jgi:hypothetical protein
MDDRAARRVAAQHVSVGTGTVTKREPIEIKRSLLSSSVVGSANRGIVIQTLFDLGPTGRAELARRAGVNRTTISGIVQPLIDGDILIETALEPATRSEGKPARPLWFSPKAPPVCGVLLMPDAVRACLVGLDGAVIGENRVALPQGDGPRSNHQGYQKIGTNGARSCGSKAIGYRGRGRGLGRHRSRFDRGDESRPVA